MRTIWPRLSLCLAHQGLLDPLGMPDIMDCLELRESLVRQSKEKREMLERKVHLGNGVLKAFQGLMA